MSTDRPFYVLNAVLSTAALAFLFYLLVVRQSGGDAAASLSFLPALNASLNATAATLLVTGWFAIRRGRERAHRFCMVGAFTASSLFLVSYIVYHWAHGDTRYVGGMRALYLLILASHVLLSMAVVPLVLTTLYLAWKDERRRHRSVARVTLPLWLYVSVTGVVIFFMLRGSQTTNVVPVPSGPVGSNVIVPP